MDLALNNLDESDYTIESILVDEHSLSTNDHSPYLPPSLNNQSKMNNPMNAHTPQLFPQLQVRQEMHSINMRKKFINHLEYKGIKQKSSEHFTTFI